MSSRNEKLYRFEKMLEEDEGKKESKLLFPRVLLVVLL